MFDIESYNKYIKSKYQSSEPSSSVILKDGTLVLYIELRSDIKYITTIERNRRTYPDGSVSYHTDNYYRPHNLSVKFRPWFWFDKGFPE
jgi:hypothetical protein